VSDEGSSEIKYCKHSAITIFSSQEEIVDLIVTAVSVMWY